MTNLLIAFKAVQCWYGYFPHPYERYGIYGWPLEELLMIAGFAIIILSCSASCYCCFFPPYNRLFQRDFLFITGFTGCKQNKGQFNSNTEHVNACFRTIQYLAEWVNDMLEQSNNSLKMLIQSSNPCIAYSQCIIQTVIQNVGKKTWDARSKRC